MLIVARTCCITKGNKAMSCATGIGLEQGMRLSSKRQVVQD